jgi:hypothetical protein
VLDARVVGRLLAHAGRIVDIDGVVELGHVITYNYPQNKCLPYITAPADAPATGARPLSQI